MEVRVKAVAIKSGWTAVVAVAMMCLPMVMPGVAMAGSDSTDSANKVSVAEAQPESAAQPKPDPTAQPQPAAIEDGLYELRLEAASKQALSVKGASLSAGANVVVGKRKTLNSQVFAIHRAGAGCYRICSPLSNMAVSAEGSAKAAGANVRMKPYKAKANQLWRAEQLDGGAIRFVNRASGMSLTSKSALNGANVFQTTIAEPGSATAKRQGFKLVKAKINLKDRASYVQVAEMATSGGQVKISNKARGYKVNKKKWKELRAAVRACNFSLGFVMIDCNTGMAVSYNPGESFFGASTIKGLYTTYLFESELEKGRLSKNRISSLVQQTIVWSNNDTYRSLRWGYGSQSRFSKWLHQVGVGSLGLWPSYSPRTLAKAWINMLAYSNSKGKHVGYWKRTFDHSHMSSIHDALGKYRTTYTKPGWMTGGGPYGYKLNDGGVVNDRHGRQYVLAILTSADPYGQKSKVERVVKALDAIHMDMPKLR